MASGLPFDWLKWSPTSRNPRGGRGNGMKHLVPNVARLSLIIVALGTLVSGAQHAAAASTQIAKDITTHLMSLPYYGVFDLLTFNVDPRGGVNLGGYVVNDSLKNDSEREVREVKGVTEVLNKIAIAPNLPLDDGIRHGVYHAIYGDSSLSRYGTPGSELWSMRPGFRGWGAGFGGRGFGGPGFGGPRLMGAPFYGYDPVGNYAIHILVDHGTVTLAGVVDSEGDKTLAGLKARGVTNVRQVNNSLEVATKS
jgi:hyperosmotically inducible protein